MQCSLPPSLLAVGDSETIVHVEADSGGVSSRCINIILEKANEALGRCGVFVLAVSGGSIPPRLSQLVEIANTTDIQFHKWKFIFADERCVPIGHHDSNYKLWMDEIFTKIPSFNTELNVLHVSHVDDAYTCAQDYYARLSSFLSLERALDVTDTFIDLAVLGMGPDGHTASLFPSHPLVTAHCVDEKRRESSSATINTTTAAAADSTVVVCLTDSPKLPPSRITLSLPALNNSREVLFIVTGAEKADVVSKIFHVHVKDEGTYQLNVSRSFLYPASLVRTEHSGRAVQWVLDAPAGEALLPP